MFGKTNKPYLEDTEDIPLKDRLISNTIYLFIDWFALSVIGFAYWSISGKLLLPGEYGIVSTAVNLALLLGGASLLGLNSTVWKLIPEYQTRREHGKIISLVRFSLKVVLISNAAILLGLLVLSPIILPILKIPMSVLVLSGAILVTYSIALQFRFIIYAFQDMRRLAVTDFLSQLTKVAVSPLLIFLGFKYFGPLVGFLFGQIILVVLRIGSIPLTGKSVKINERFIMFTYAMPAFITGLGWLVFTNGQYVLLTALQNPAVTGVYTVGLLLTSVLVIVPTTLNSALLPITSRLSAERDLKNRRIRLIQLVLRYSLLITLPLAVLLFLFSETAILLFSRVEYLSAVKFFPLLILGSVIYGMSGIFLDNIYAVGKPKATRNIVVIMTLVFLSLAVPLIYLFSATGAAAAYTISSALVFLLSYLYLRKHLKLSTPYGSIFKLAISLIVSFGFLYLVIGIADNLVLRLILAALSLLLYLTILVPLRFYTKDDIKILDFFAKKSPILNKQIIRFRDLLAKFVK